MNLQNPLNKWWGKGRKGKIQSLPTKKKVEEAYQNVETVGNTIKNVVDGNYKEPNE